MPRTGVLDALCVAVPASIVDTWRGCVTLASIWDDAWSRVQDAWPELSIDERGFAEWVGARLRDDDEPVVLEGLDVEGLALAFACARGGDAAAEAFRARHGRDIELALDRCDSIRRAATIYARS